MSWCLTVGISLIVVAAIMALFWEAKKKNPSLSNKGKSAGNLRRRSRSAYSLQPHHCLNAFDDGYVNYDDICALDASHIDKKSVFSDQNDADFVVIDDDSSPIDAMLLQEPSPGSMVLASLESLKMPETVAPAPRPKLPGQDACELGVRYFDYLLAHHVVPRGARHLTSEANISTAMNALKNARQTATLSHGAVAQRIGEKAVCLFEPLDMPVLHLDKALELIRDLLEQKTIFIIIANRSNASEECFAHLRPLCQKYLIPKSCIYMEQDDGSFVNYIENANDFVPSRLEPMTMSQLFFSNMLDYAHEAYDDGDHEAVLRTIEPLMAPLLQRVAFYQNFPKVLLAQALNLLGMTFRDIGNDERAILAFDRSLAILREIEDYEAIKSVLANLGITLALTRPVLQENVERAIRHLNEVTQLNPRDDEAWLYLANSYLELYRITNAQSLLKRAQRAYDKAYDLAPTPQVASCREALARQIDEKRQRTTKCVETRVASGSQDNRASRANAR